MQNIERAQSKRAPSIDAFQARLREPMEGLEPPLLPELPPLERPQASSLRSQTKEATKPVTLKPGPSKTDIKGMKLINALGLETSVPRSDDPHRDAMLKGLQGKSQSSTKQEPKDSTTAQDQYVDKRPEIARPARPRSQQPQGPPAPKHSRPHSQTPQGSPTPKYSRPNTPIGAPPEPRPDSTDRDTAAAIQRANAIPPPPPPPRRNRGDAPAARSSERYGESILVSIQQQSYRAQRPRSEPPREIFNYFGDDPIARQRAERTVLLSEPPSESEPPDSGHTSASEDIRYPARLPTEQEVGPRQRHQYHAARSDNYRYSAQDGHTLQNTPREVRISRSLPELLPNVETAQARQHADRPQRTQSHGANGSHRRPYATLLPRSPVPDRHGHADSQ